MRRLAKNLILATLAVSAILLVDLSSVEAANLNYEKFYPFNTYKDSLQCLDFWSKFRDTVMPDPDEHQDNNPPKPVEPEPPKPENKPAPKPENKTPPKPVEKPAD